MNSPLISATIFSPFPEVVFDVSTRYGGDDILRSLHVGSGDATIPRQVHGNTVQRVSQPGVYPDCDALITNEPQIYLKITAADCFADFSL